MKKLNPVLRNILYALAIAFFGLILLNLAFLFDFAFQTLLRGFFGLFIEIGPDMQLYWFPFLMHGLFVVVILLISYFIFRSKLKPIYKAIYMTVPVAVVLVTAGMFLSHWPVIAYSTGALLCIATLYYFYKTKQPWLYYYTVILVSVALAIFTATGGEI
ncbi:hypothetical protein KY311_01685 [Candidatus Woesearchaeota archaeon]|nr:hypothetical protein [Candidatus Woesearchaeota archaeon]MBW3016933.1 hypothetical protein [Candidatus Woesearchaeota archaeon]